MADKDELKPEVDQSQGKSKGGATRLVFFFLIALVAGGGMAGGFLYFMPAGDPSENDVADVASAPIIYKALEPALLGNIEGPGRVRFVQVGLMMAARDPRAMDAVDQHMPVIRNNLIMLLSDKSYEDLNTTEGKETTRQEMLDVIREVLREHTGEPGIESIYFTSFVMQ